MDTPSLAAGIGNIYSHSELDNNSRDYSWLLHALYKHSINVTPPFREWIHLKCKGRFAMRIKWGADGLLDVLKRALDKISNTWLQTAISDRILCFGLGFNPALLHALVGFHFQCSSQWDSKCHRLLHRWPILSLVHKENSSHCLLF